MGDKGTGIGGLANTREDYTSSRYNHYAPFTFEEEIKDTETFIYFPQTIVENYTGSMPIVFNIPSEVEWYTKLKTIKLHGEFSVWNKTEGAAPLSSEVWSLINNPVHSFFSNCAVKINDHVIVDSTSNPYPFKAYLENLLVPSKWYADSIMSVDGWKRDVSQTAALGETSFDHRRIGISSGGHKGRVLKYNIFTNNKLILEFCVPLHTDLITATRDLPPGYRLEFKLTRMKDDFVIWSPQSNKKGTGTNAVPYEYEIRLKDLRLSVQKVKVVDRIFNHYYNGQNGRIPEIPFTRNMLRTYTKTDQIVDLGFPNFVEQQQLPEVFIIHLEFV